MRYIRVRIILAILVVFSLTSFFQSKAKILIIGDSISIGYTPFVQEYLKDAADVFHNPGNAQHTGTGLEQIEEWIGDTDWDIVQFNWGLWDLCYRHPESGVQGNRDKINGKITFDVEDYGNNLDSIVRLIKKKSNAKLIFVTTSYVPENEAGRFQEDAIAYNRTAIKIMRDHQVIVHDIYEKSRSIHQRFGKGSNDVHYLPEGYRELGLIISDFLRNEIE